LIIASNGDDFVGGFMRLKNEKGKAMIVLLIIIIILLTIIAYPIVKENIDERKEKENVHEDLSFECLSALAAIRSAYRVHFDDHGSYDDYSVDLAIKDCMLSNSVKSLWSFEVLGYPPVRYIATSTSNNPIGSGKTIHYDVKSATYEGYGID
jgi:hypothetical protein